MTLKLPLESIEGLMGSPQHGDELTLELLVQVTDVLVNQDYEGVLEVSPMMIRVTHHEMNPGKGIIGAMEHHAPSSSPIPSPSG